MANITLTLAKDHADLSNFGNIIIIPAGTSAQLLDIIIEDGNVSFLLAFETGIEWVDLDEVEERF